MCRGLKFTHGISICISGVWSFIPQFVNPEKWAMVLPCFTYGFTCDVAIWVYRRDGPTHEKRSLQGAKQHETTL